MAADPGRSLRQMEADTALITGTFTLGGVIVGGTLNNWLSYVLENSSSAACRALAS
jgi:hypothetical protein